MKIRKIKKKFCNKFHWLNLSLFFTCFTFQYGFFSFLHIFVTYHSRFTLLFVRCVLVLPCCCCNLFYFFLFASDFVRWFALHSFLISLHSLHSLILLILFFEFQLCVCTLCAHCLSHQRLWLEFQHFYFPSLSLSLKQRLFFSIVDVNIIIIIPD